MATAAPGWPMVTRSNGFGEKKGLRGWFVFSLGGPIILFPDCFHIAPDPPKFPLIFLGKCYIFLLDIFAKYFLNFSGLHFFSCTLHTQEVTGSNPVAPTISREWRVESREWF